MAVPAHGQMRFMIREKGICRPNSGSWRRRRSRHCRRFQALEDVKIMPVTFRVSLKKHTVIMAETIEITGQQPACVGGFWPVEMHDLGFVVPSPIGLPIPGRRKMLPTP